MDVLAACRAFVSVGRHASFTAGAAAARIPQSVASRRVAALEAHLGAALLERTSRHVALTPFGVEMLLPARRLVDLADAFEHDAEQARRRPFHLAVPASCETRDLAHLVAGARRRDLHLDLVAAEPAEREHLARTLRVRAAVVAVPAQGATWSVPLGVAARTAPASRAVRLEGLRVPRGSTAASRRVWVQPEDDVPHVRDRLTRARDALGLRPAQVAVATSTVAAVGEVLTSEDLLLCPREQADELALTWRPLADTNLERGYDLTAASSEDAGALLAALHTDLARCLRATQHPEQG